MEWMKRLSPALAMIGLFCIPCSIAQTTDAQSTSAPASAPAATEQRIAALIVQLGDDSTAKREQASRELVEIGVPAMPAIRRAAGSNDPEVAARARELRTSILRTAMENRECMRWVVELDNNLSRRFAVTKETVVFFHTGDMKDVFTMELIQQRGTPDVVILDPPRAGLHPKVIEALMLIMPKRMIYVSCNPSSQARDISMFQDYYWITGVQPVDMFPHTHHVENVVELNRRP